MLGKCDKVCCKESIELLLKVVFVAVFAYGVFSSVCYMKSCCKAGVVQTAKQCGANCLKTCCAK